MPQHHNINFSPEELARYNRHIIIPDFGLEAQQKLKAGRVLVVGSGGLGSPLLLYLAAAGVGTIGIVDFDVVDDSNLQRQVLFGHNDAGQPKVEAARRRLESLNPYIDIRVHPVRLDSQNALDIIADYDVRCPGPSTRIRLLSGGNMQKLILGRAMAGGPEAGGPEIILANQPVRGLDVGAIAYVQSQLIAARNRGAAVLLISEDLDEIMGLSDVIHVISQGRLSPGFARGTMTAADLGLWMAGQKFEGAHAA